MITITQLTTPAIAGQPVQFQATISDITIGFGDGSIGSNVLNFSHTFFAPGIYPIGLTIHLKNQSEIGGTKVTVEAAPQPVPIPAPAPPPPPPVPPPATGRQLLGGWRLTCPFARGAIAIDWTTNILHLVGHAQRNEVLRFRLPAMGTGTDPSQWPILLPFENMTGWWTADPNPSNGQLYCNALAFFRGKLWAAPRVLYDEAPIPVLNLYASDGTILTVSQPRGSYSGFVKNISGDPFIGGGGYESGQGWSTGPSLATLDGQSLIYFPQTGAADWQLREHRDTNYSPKNGIDDWTAIAPKMINGQLTGIWASDRVRGGGLVLPEGITYWPWQGVGVVDYTTQTENFTASNQTSAYLYDKSTYQRISWTLTDLEEIGGQEIGPDGKVYLSEINSWKSDLYQVDPVIKVYG